MSSSVFDKRPAQGANRGSPIRPRRPAEILREAIDKAVAEGGKLDDMMLLLTLSDASELKRDRTLAVEDISFAGGIMRFLGVKVTPGGVTSSRLEPSGVAPAKA